MNKCNAKKIIVQNLGIIHYCAFCCSCGWKYQDYRDRREGQKQIRKHVSETGHTIQLEKSSAVEYKVSYQ